MRREKPRRVLLPPLLGPGAARVNELAAGSFTPWKTSWPLMLKTGLLPSGSGTDVTKEEPRFHWREVELELFEEVGVVEEAAEAPRGGNGGGGADAGTERVGLR